MGQRSKRKAGQDQHQIHITSCYLSLCLFVGKCCFSKRDKQWVPITRRRFKFRVILNTDIERMNFAWQFHDFAQIFGRCTGRNDQTCCFNARQVVVICLVTMTMTFCHYIAVNFCSQRAWFDGASLRTQTHRATEIRIFITLFNFTVLIFPFIDQRNDWLFSFRIKLSGVSHCQACRAARILPSTPRLPKPPGTRIASYFSKAFVPFASISSESTYSMLTRLSVWIPAWRNASVSDLYDSVKSTYLPTIPMVTCSFGFSRA